MTGKTSDRRKRSAKMPTGNGIPPPKKPPSEEISLVPAFETMEELYQLCAVSVPDIPLHELKYASQQKMKQLHKKQSKKREPMYFCFICNVQLFELRLIPVHFAKKCHKTKMEIREKIFDAPVEFNGDLRIFIIERLNALVTPFDNPNTSRLGSLTVPISLENLVYHKMVYKKKCFVCYEKLPNIGDVTRHLEDIMHHKVLANFCTIVECVFGFSCMQRNNVIPDILRIVGQQMKQEKTEVILLESSDVLENKELGDLNIKVDEESSTTETTSSTDFKLEHVKKTNGIQS